MNTYTDLNKLIVAFCLPNDFARLSKKSLNLIIKLISHKGEGSLFQCLKSYNYVSDITLDSNSCCLTAFRLISVELELTETGMQNY